MRGYARAIRYRYSPRIIREGLVLWLPLWNSELSESTFKSKDDYHQSCVVTDATWGIYGRTFNGSSAFIACGDTPSVTDNVSVCAWIYAADYSGNYLIVVGGDDDNAPFQLRTNSTNKKIEFCINAGGNRAIGATALVNGTWNFVCGTFDKALASNEIKLYLNGNATPDGQASHNTSISTTDSLYIGKRDNEKYWSGRISEVLIYNRTLSLVEIIHNYNATKFRYA